MEDLVSEQRIGDIYIAQHRLHLTAFDAGTQQPSIEKVILGSVILIYSVACEPNRWVACFL